jgi:hypothetical protein
MNLDTMKYGKYDWRWPLVLGRRYNTEGMCNPASRIVGMEDFFFGGGGGFGIIERRKRRISLRMLGEAIASVGRSDGAGDELFIPEFIYTPPTAFKR